MVVLDLAKLLELYRGETSPAARVQVFKDMLSCMQMIKDLPPELALEANRIAKGLGLAAIAAPALVTPATAAPTSLPPPLEMTLDEARALTDAQRIREIQQELNDLAGSLNAFMEGHSQRLRRVCEELESWSLAAKGN